MGACQDVILTSWSRANAAVRQLDAEHPWASGSVHRPREMWYSSMRSFSTLSRYTLRLPRRPATARQQHTEHTPPAKGSWLARTVSAGRQEVSSPLNYLGQHYPYHLRPHEPCTGEDRRQRPRRTRSGRGRDQRLWIAGDRRVQDEPIPRGRSAVPRPTAPAATRCRWLARRARRPRYRTACGPTHRTSISQGDRRGQRALRNRERRLSSGTDHAPEHRGLDRRRSPSRDSSRTTPERKAPQTPESGKLFSDTGQARRSV